MDGTILGVDASVILTEIAVALHREEERGKERKKKETQKELDTLYREKKS